MVKKVRIKFFATLRHLTGRQEVEIELPDDATVQDLKDALILKFPEIKDAVVGGIVSVNHEFAFDEDLLPEDAEIAVFPQVSGGDASKLPEVCELTDEEFDFMQVVNRIKGPTTGAVCTFTGLVRELTKTERDQRTLYLEYEAYEQMALEKMQQIVNEIRMRWPEIYGVAIIQRLGKIPSGEPTVMVSCTASHRDSGVFEAAEYGINRLKEIVPVWKKEIGPDGQKWIEGHYRPSENDRNTLH